MFFSTSVLEAQSLKEKIGQMIIVGFNGGQTSQDSLMYDITNRNLGGVLIFAYNLRFPSQIKAQNNRLQNAATTPLFISIDQEGGYVARLDENNGFSRTFSAHALGNTFDNEDSTRAQAKLMGGWLKEYGFNLNYAPVVDVNVDANSPAIGKLNRSFSNNEYKVYEHAAWTINEFQKQGIISSLKHFPGHGSAVNDSHNDFTDISNTWQARELDPYELLIDDGFNEIVMTGHLYKSDWDTLYPASLSHFAITEILRDSLGFQGLVITDELFMRAIRDNYGFDEAIVTTINAGTDILLFNTNLYKDVSLPGYLITLISKKVSEGEITEARINESYNRIMAIKAQKLVTSNEGDVAQITMAKPIQIDNYPNPFNPSTNIKVEFPQSQQALVDVFNSLGQKIRTLANQRFSSGAYTFMFNGSDLASGVYFVRVQGELIDQTHKIVLLK